MGAGETETNERSYQNRPIRRAVRRILMVAIPTLLLTLVVTYALSRLVPEVDLFATPGKGVANVMTYIQHGFSSAVDTVVQYLYTLKLRTALELEYNVVKQENEQLVYRAMLADELQRKLEVYENLYNEISVNESMNPLVARVIGREAGNYFSGFTINKGSNDGVQDLMAVTMGGALVGYTYNVSATKSNVIAIIDSTASIAGLIASSRDQGTVRGTLGIDGQPMCRMYYLPEEHLPRPGDQVVTSGVGMSFPKGIPIGVVRESTRGMESNKQYIVVQPLADFQHIEYVIVLRYQPLAEAIPERASGAGVLAFTPLDTALPVPTIQIGNDFYQLAPTPVPTVTPQGEVTGEITGEIEPDSSDEPTQTPSGGGYEYHVPVGNPTDQSYGYTLPPTPTPTPTPRALDTSVEED